MATYGLKNLYRAPVTVDTGGVITYGTPVKMAAAIQVDIAVEFKEGKLEADDKTTKKKIFKKALLTINQADLTPADRAALLGETEDLDGVVYSGMNDDPPRFAIGYQMAMDDGLYTWKWLYDVKFSVPNETGMTDKEDAFEYTTSTIVGDVSRRESDNLWQATHVAASDDAVAAAWFIAVREPNLAA